VHVPDLDEAIGIMRGGGVLGVGGKNEFGELWAMLDGSSDRPETHTFVEKSRSEIMRFLLQRSSQNCAISFIRLPFLPPLEP
jgi:hypothetical protein